METKGVKLIGMCDYVLEDSTLYCDDWSHNVLQYAYFLMLKLELWMFVACDKDGKPLEKPINNRGFLESNEAFAIREKVFQEAQSKCIFIGCTSVFRPVSNADYYEVRNNGICWVSWNDSKTVEDMLQYDLTLTSSKAQDLGLIK